MKAAASSLPPALVGPAHAREEGGTPTMTRVAIGECGVVKIVHLVHMNRAAHANAGGHHHHHSGGYGDSQRYGAGGGTRGTGGTQGHGGTRGGGTQGPGSYVVPVTFVAYAEVEIDEDEGYNEPEPL